MVEWWFSKFLSVVFVVGLLWSLLWGCCGVVGLLWSLLWSCCGVVVVFVEVFVVELLWGCCGDVFVVLGVMRYYCYGCYEVALWRYVVRLMLCGGSSDSLIGLSLGCASWLRLR